MRATLSYNEWYEIQFFTNSKKVRNLCVERDVRGAPMHSVIDSIAAKISRDIYFVWCIKGAACSFFQHYTEVCTYECAVFGFMQNNCCVKNSYCCFKAYLALVGAPHGALDPRSLLSGSRIHLKPVRKRLRAIDTKPSDSQRSWALRPSMKLGSTIDCLKYGFSCAK